ncbi:hypothetical protein SLS57_011026, partial [Botryosphaeria dothidea]
MRFSTIFFTLASLGAAYAAMEQPAVDEEMLVKREEFREPVKRSAQSWGGQGGWGKPWGGQPSNPGWGGPVWASGSCDADNDCPRICRNQYGDQFNDEGTKCCFNACSCAGGCEGNGS